MPRAEEEALEVARAANTNPDDDHDFEVFKAEYKRRLTERHRRLLADASSSYRAMADWGEVEGPEDWQETVRKADEGLDNGSFLIERLGADRHLDPTLMAMLLAMRRRLIDEHGVTTAAELMLVDCAVLSYYHFLRVNGWIGNLGQWLEAEFFQLAAPSAGLVGPFGSDNRKPFQGEEVTQRIAERLMPLLDRANRMLLRNLKALRERRQGPTPSVSIGAAGQVNVSALQQVNGAPNGHGDEPGAAPTPHVVASPTDGT